MIPLLIISALFGTLGVEPTVLRPAPIPIPNQTFGIVLGNSSPNAPVQLEVFLELLCHDSHVTWDVLKQLVARYNANDLRIIVHQFPMPYHRNAFLVTQALFQLQAVKFEKLPIFIEYIFNNMGNFDSEQENVRQFLTHIVSNLSGITPDQISSTYSRYYDITKTAWKFGARRGVAGAPWYFLNGVELSLSSEPIQLAQFIDILNPLIRSSRRLQRASEPDTVVVLPQSQQRDTDPVAVPMAMMSLAHRHMSISPPLLLSACALVFGLFI